MNTRRREGVGLAGELCDGVEHEALFDHIGELLSVLSFALFPRRSVVRDCGLFAPACVVPEPFDDFLAHAGPIWAAAGLADLAAREGTAAAYFPVRRARIERRPAGDPGPPVGGMSTASGILAYWSPSRPPPT